MAQREVLMPEKQDGKAEALREQGALHPHPEAVKDELFLESEFFDPRDLVMVKYEMLRQARVEGQSITQAAAAFGLSRVTFYEAQAAFAEGGLPGLIPKRRGPKGAHKLTDEVLAFLDQERAQDKRLRAPILVDKIQERFGISVHPRSIERALARRQKGGS